MRATDAAIEKYLETKTAKGSSFEQVLAEIEAQNWPLDRVSHEHGVTRIIRGVGYEVVGTSSIRAELGSYGLIFNTYVSASWAFNQAGELIFVKVTRSTDAI